MACLLLIFGFLALKIKKTMNSIKPQILTTILSVCLSQFMVFQVNATSLTATIDTSSIAGTDAQLAFDFLAGDGAVLNSVTISNFLSDGTLGGASLIGSASGSLPGTVTLQNTGFFNEALQSILLGNSISFNFTLTENLDPSATIPDAFSVFLLDSSGSTLFPTTDPTGADALFAVDIDGTSTGNLNVYLADSGITSPVTWSVNSSSTVPEPSVIFLLAAGLIGLGYKKRY